MGYSAKVIWCHDDDRTSNMAVKLKNVHVKLCMMILSESGW